MLKLKETEFKIQFSELNIKQRLFEDKSYVTLELKTNFYPNFSDYIVYGNIDVTIDCEIKSLDDLVNSEFKTGKVVINLNEDGKWNTYNFTEFNLKFGLKNMNEIDFTLKTDETVLEATTHITSLYTVGNKKIEKYFNMNDFHEKPVVKEITNKQIYKFFTK